jgi:DNA-binding LacI/PurR family transcriptional regulator
MPKEDNSRQMSLRDIAREAGVSVSTVSRVLSGSKSTAKISDKTRERILSICENMKFHPNIHYRRLHEGLSRVIAFLIPPPDRSLMFFDENVGCFLSALEPRLARHGFHIMIQSTTPDFLAERQHLEILRSHAVDGVILWDVCRDDENLRDMIQEGKPIIKAAFPSDILVDQIIPDNFAGSRDLTLHLVEQGHKNIAHIAGGHTRVDHEREAGYREAIETADLKPIMFEGHYSFKSGYEWGERILKKYPDITAIMAANDLAAAGCLRRLKELGCAVPDDIAVTGFDGTSHSMITDPPITTARLQLDEIGKLAADRIVKAVISPEKYRPQLKKLPMPVLVRESTSSSVTETSA